MTVEAQLADGTVLEFPNGTAPEVIQRVVKSRLGVKPQETKPRGLGETLGRQAGLTARMAINGVSGLPVLASNAVGGLYNTGANLIQGEGKGFRFPEHSGQLNLFLTKLGLPAPETSNEQLVQAVGGALTGVGAYAKVGQKIGGMVEEILTKNLGTQALGAGTGATLAEVTRQQGGSPLLQGAASVLGSLGAVGAKGIIQGARTPVATATESFRQPGRDQVKARLLDNLSGNQRYALIDALEKNRTTALGNKNTTALAAADLNMPELAAAEKYLGGRYAGNSFAQLAEDNAQGRALALKGISGTPAAREALAQDIKAQGEVSYGKAFSSDRQRLDDLARQEEVVRSMGGATGFTAPSRVSENLLALQGNPVIQAAMREAEILARSRGTSLGENPMESLQGLHLMKLAIDNQFKNRTASTALQNYSDEALNSTKQALLRGIEGTENNPGVSPFYGVARQQFAESSAPLNQMKIAQYLADKLKQPLDEGVERSGMFAQALRDAPGTLKKTVGGRPQELSDVMNPQQIDTIDNISNELTKLAMVNKQATQGLPSATQKIGEPFKMPNIPTLLSAPVSVGKSIFQAAKGQATETTLKELANDMQDPQKVAALLRGMKPQEKFEFAKMLKNLGIDSSLGAVYGNMPYKEN
jgi:hypothetical protein